MKTPKPVKSFKHKESKRAHIPSAEEAGYEAGSPKVQAAPHTKDLPLNPIIARGQDPELFWMHKYGSDARLTAQLDELHAKLKAGDNPGARTALENLRETIMRRYQEPDDETLSVDIRSLYRHEHIAPETLIKGLYRIVAEQSATQDELFSVNELFGNAIGHEELDKVTDYYTHSDGWTNRLIQGDSLLVMTSLLEREGMAGQVQCLYMDPPYGIKYGSNWQIKLNNRNVTDGQDDSLSGQPEQIKAFRDTWELGIHSYLSYLRDRLQVARELLHESGSCFVQISDENAHLVRCLMDEVFGSANFVAQVNVRKTGGKGSSQLDTVFDYILWYAKNIEGVKYRPLFTEKEIGIGKGTGERYDQIELTDGERRPLSPEEKAKPKLLRPLLDGGAKLYQLTALISESSSASTTFTVKMAGREFSRTNWKTNEPGFQNLIRANRVAPAGETLRYVRYFEDFPATAITNYWDDTGVADKVYVIQTAEKVIARCLLMTTDPGDLALDPTCGSGTTACVAERWGRRWIACDTSRIALNIAKTRLMTASFPYYQLYDQTGADLRQGFVYKKVRHVTLRSIANGEPPEEETLYDQPQEDKKRLRVAGPFTVETLQSYDPISPEELARQREQDSELANFEDLIFEHLKTAGVKTGDKRENAVFVRIDRLANSALHAEAWYQTATGEKKAYLHIGPKFGTVSNQAVTEAIKACRDKRDGDWLLILGFAFESGLSDVTTRDFGHFKVSIVRMHDDLLQQGLLKRDKKAASFVTIGEPDIRLHRKNGTATVEIAGLDIYDPIQDEVKSRDVHDIAYWMVDDDYDGSNFVVRQVFFCGGDKDEFEEWKKGLSDLAKAKTKKAAEQTLKVEIDDEAFSRVYGHASHPFPVKNGQKIAVRVISQFGEETTKVVEVKS
jgi:adenine-specific DNA-methyltransferase